MMSAEEQLQYFHDRLHALEVKVLAIDGKVDRLLVIFERGSGAWWLLRYLGALVIGVAALWATIGDHIHWR
jgi:hypothetical protein